MRPGLTRMEKLCCRMPNKRYGASLMRTPLIVRDPDGRPGTCGNTIEGNFIGPYPILSSVYLLSEGAGNEAQGISLLFQFLDPNVAIVHHHGGPA
jgi:hypothetical protein